MKTLPIVLSALAILSSVPAWAHGGADTVYEGTVGPYLVVAEVSLRGGTTPQTAHELDYSLYFREAETQEPIPVNDTTVRITTETPEGPINATSKSRFEHGTSIHYPLSTLGS